jgi:hypothetical protein
MMMHPISAPIGAVMFRMLPFYRILNTHIQNVVGGLKLRCQDFM